MSEKVTNVRLRSNHEVIKTVLLYILIFRSVDSPTTSAFLATSQKMVAWGGWVLHQTTQQQYTFLGLSKVLWSTYDYCCFDKTKMTTRDSYLNKITILKNKKTLNWLVANKSAKSILSLIPIPFSTTTPVIWGVPSPSKKVVCYFGPFHRPSLALSGISPLHILLAC